MSDPQDTPEPSEKRERERGREAKHEPRQVSMPVMTVATLLVSLLSSLGSGSFVSSRSSEALRERDVREAEARVRVESRLEALQTEVRRSSEMASTYWTELRAVDRSMDERLRAVELQQARGAGPPR